jgi:uncharacterized protein YjiS (DUF1127 family)
MLLPHRWNSPLAVLPRIIHAYVARMSILASAARERFKTMFLAIVRFIQSWKSYNSALRELSLLSDRELADVGISRSDIPRVAWDQATR